MPKKLAIIYGNPGNGKSYLATRILAPSHGYHVVCGDHTYVTFIHDMHPELYFTQLGRFIGPQYEAIVDRWLKLVAAEWWSYLAGQILRALQTHDKVAVTWYRLNELNLAPFQANPDIEIKVVKVVDGRNQKYEVDGREMKVDEFA